MADTTDDAQVARAVAEAVRSLGGGIDILVNAAAEPGGYARAAAATPTSRVTFLQREIDVKVMGYLRVAREVAPHMKEQAGAGSSTSAVSRRARRATPLAACATSRSRRCRRTWPTSSARPGSTSPSSIPGLTRTERTADAGACAGEGAGLSEEEILKRMADGNSIRHLVDAAEVADVVAFLASPKSIAINGDAIAAGGGAPRAIHY